MRSLFYIIIILFAFNISLYSQELRAKININRSQIQGTDDAVFEALERTMEQFLNTRRWSPYPFRDNERIPCNFNITVTQYDRSNNLFTCKALIQVNRPVFNSVYTSILYNNTDADFNFEFSQFDQIEFNEDNITNQLSALMAYYAYLIIGLDLDSFGKMGGEELLQRAMTIVINAQNLPFAGWRSFENDRNRFAYINDYLDVAMQPYRNLQYVYYREGLDQMADNTEKAREAITTAIVENLKVAHDNRPLSLLPQIFTEYKRDELVNIYKGQGTQASKQKVYDALFSINASLNNQWEQLMQ